jgi:hypothetical protein
MDIVKKNPDKPWEWYCISMNPNITWDIIRDNPDKPWSWKGISSNPNITMDIVRDNPYKPWDWFVLRTNLNLIWKTDWYCIDPNITMDTINENPEKPWNWRALSINPNIMLSDLELCTIIRKHRSTKIIKIVWRCAVSDPNYIVCKKRLLREFEEGVGN